MGRLTFENPDGTWGLVGHDIKKVPSELYGCICKLKDYENTMMSPQQIEDMREYVCDKLCVYSNSQMSQNALNEICAVCFLNKPRNT